MWNRYIDWIDRDLGDGRPDMRSWSSIVPIVPLIIAIGPLAWFDPPAPVRYAILFALAVPTAGLFGIWTWRVVIVSRRYLSAIRAQRGAKPPRD